MSRQVDSLPRARPSMSRMARTGKFQRQRPLHEDHVRDLIGRMEHEAVAGSSRPGHQPRRWYFLIVSASTPLRSASAAMDSVARDGCCRPAGRDGGRHVGVATEGEWRTAGARATVGAECDKSSLLRRSSMLLPFLCDLSGCLCILRKCKLSIKIVLPLTVQMCTPQIPFCAD